jgi:hypothetical protein
MYTCRLKGRIAELEEAAVARQWHCKQVSTATNMPATTEQPQEEVFSVQ